MSRSGKGLETKQCSCSTPPLTGFSHCRVCTEAPVIPRSLGCGQVIPGGGTGVKEERKLRFSKVSGQYSYIDEKGEYMLTS